jgi:hypothetical protein
MLLVFLYGCCVCLNGFQLFLQVFQMYISSVLFIYFCTLHVLHLDVLKVDRVLHKGCAWKAEGGTSGHRAGDIWAARAPHDAGDAGAVKRLPDSVGPRVDVRNEGENRLQQCASRHRHPSGHPRASTAMFSM